jgi:hypothetical protein
MAARYAILSLGLLALLPMSGAAADTAWEQWVPATGVFDVGGPRSDGVLLVAGSGQLYSLTRAGSLKRFASGYHDDPGAEPYLAVSPGLTVASAGCTFAGDDTYILRLHPPIGITRVDGTGERTSLFTNVDMPGMNGIAFDTVGSFDHRLLATGGVAGKTEVIAIDCTGAVRVITKTAPVMEGGIAVAPTGFGTFGGSLIGPDELSGVIWSVGPDGTTHQVVASGLPHGGDIGVESLAFVPPGFSRGGYLYYSDRLTPSNPHPGTDHVLRLSSVDLVAAGVQDGDLLAATEGGATMIDVRCDTSCHVTTLVGTATIAHGEVHLVFAINQAASPLPSPSPQVTVSPPSSAGSAANTAIGIMAIVAVISVGAWLVLSRRRR